MPQPGIWGGAGRCPLQAHEDPLRGMLVGADGRPQRSRPCHRNSPEENMVNRRPAISPSVVAQANPRAEIERRLANRRARASRQERIDHACSWIRGALGVAFLVMWGLSLGPG